MYASRFELPDDKSLAQKMLDNANSLKIHLHKSDDGKCFMDYTVEGTFGDSDNEDDFPKVGSDQAKDHARELLAAFLGNQ